ncbi:MAG: FapA family protein [Oscillospiraceae bacterium]
MSENIDNRTLAQPVHSIAELSVNPNFTTAFLSFTRPENGGLDITYEKAVEALEAKNITCGVLEEDIRKAVEEKRYGENICAARWTPPVDGVDGKITYHFDTSTVIAPVEDEHGVVDYKNLGIVRNITAGTPIATITMPTEGTPGKDITGRVVPQKKGVPANIRAGAGTSLINDGTELIAAIDGNLRFLNGAFSVEEKLVINGDVDVASGNIDFIGSVTVRGSVFEGFSVTSKKDITVNGSCNGALLTAAGDISVRIGSINSTINAGGKVVLGFCENSRITAGGDVESQSFVGGEVFAGNDIRAVGKGVMVGGKYTALNNIDAMTIGSENYTRTMLILGNNAVLFEERENLKRSIKELEDKAEQLGMILNSLSEMQKVAKLPPEREQMKAEALRNRLKMQAEVRKAQARINEINTTLELAQNLYISCRKTLYPGVTLRINSSIMQVNSKNCCCRAAVVGGDIVIKPL